MVASSIKYVMVETFNLQLILLFFAIIGTLVLILWFLEVRPKTLFVMLSVATIILIVAKVIYLSTL